MKKSLILAVFLFANAANADITDKIGGATDKVEGVIQTGGQAIDKVQGWAKIGQEYYDKYFNKFDKLTFGVVSKCYNIPQPTDLNVCSYIPDIDDMGVNVCKYLPGASGTDKRTLKLRALKRNLCMGDKADEAIYRAGREYEIWQMDGLGGVGGNTDSGTNKNKVKDKVTAYEGMAEAVASENTLANTAFMSGNNRLMNEMMILLRTNKDKKMKLEDITKDDLVASLPTSIEEYDKEVETKTELLNLNIENTTPTAMSNYLENNFKNSNLSGTAAVSAASKHLQTQQQTIDTQLSNQIGDAINANRKDTDYVNPTQEMVKLMRPDIQANEVAKIKDQMRREAKIRADLTLEAQKKKNIMELITKKSLIMNEKFDREQARATINAMLQ
ncbi:hypothetical protein JJB27_08940 [Campylobacter fetus subsp. venerealis]|uniref:hypothetical protein n=1 Tax=Campylobacter fetus TaxID=196 RepID=UPI00190BB9DF|nr:hypothetical protein [Campylobacter fetus]MBK3499189.1 hypothetical protein [Campylobacter fetus subsp. venerealis]MBK3503148.1 hypothetical protein [Campylobacter fetus subsp. venerealis]